MTMTMVIIRTKIKIIIKMAKMVIITKITIIKVINKMGNKFLKLKVKFNHKLKPRNP